MPMVEREIQQVNLQRALIIGLGGCGAEVIRRVRRLLIDRFRRFENIPIVRFLYIDTDPTWLRDMVSTIEEDIRLPDSERFDAQFPDATGLYRGIREGYYPHYSWFSIEKLDPHKSVTHGAGTIRQLGRLCFWHHAAKIREKMERLVGELNHDVNAQFMQNTYNIAVDPGVNIHVIAGLAGGTGSGMFMDVAYMARRVLQTLGVAGTHQFVGYLVLPGAFRDLTGANALPNGYAALKELNYHSYMYAPDRELAAIFGRPEWDAHYTGDEINRVRFAGQAPFDYCYLLDERNPHVQLHRQHIFAMVARSLFHEFTLSFAAFKRSLRANIRNRIVDNDRRDCPRGFMSFGQSAVLLPREEIQRVLSHQLALRAVQQWIDRATKPIDIFTEAPEITNVAEASGAAIDSIKSQVQEEQTISAVRSFLIRELIPGVGLRAREVLDAILAEAQERLIDVPYSRREAEKQRWIAERWDYDRFTGGVSDAWRRWKADFNDEGPEPMKWGEQMKRLVANRERAEKEYRRRLHERILTMFEDTEKYGPTWALGAAQQLRPALEALKQQFLKEANDPVAIANLLGDVYLINATAGKQGPSLSAIIEQRIGKEFDELDKAVQRWIPISKRDRVEQESYEYLTWCAHWCRARVEERTRRLASELAESLSTALSAVERELLEYASLLARLQIELLQHAREWSQKAARTENIGQLLYDPNLLRAVETKIAERQGDQYDAAAVAQKALKRLGKTLRELRQDEVPQLLRALLEEAKTAIGDLDEQMLQDTRFAAHDLVSAQCSDDNALDQTLRRTIDSGAPFVLLNATPPGGYWVPGNDLLTIKGAGLRGGYIPPDQDQDRERARVIERLRRVDWNPEDELQAIDDSSQIVFFQECGGFPLRALQGIEEMKLAYEEHRKQGGPPLHILRDAQAERYPDLLPPSVEILKRALMIQTVAIPLGLITLRDFPHPDGNGRTLRHYAYLRHIPELNERQPVPLGETVESVGLELAYNPELLGEIEKAVDAAVVAATEVQKAEFASKLRQHLDECKEKLREEAAGADPTTMAAYQRERDRVVEFMRKHRLSMG
jgi:hypothetical protein